MSNRKARTKRKRKRTIAEYEYDFSIVKDIGTDGTAINQIKFMAMLGLHPAEATSSNMVLVSTGYSVSHAVETTCVRRHVRVQVTHLQEAHWVVSWRVGVLQVPYSNLFHKHRRRHLRQTLRALSQKFQNPILIVYKENLTPNCLNAHESQVNKAVTMYTTSSPQDTAVRLANLAREEKENGHGLYSFNQNETGTKQFQFYHNLPGINILMALRLARKFPFVGHFLKSRRASSSPPGLHALLVPIQERTNTNADPKVQASDPSVVETFCLYQLFFLDHPSFPMQDSRRCTSSNWSEHAFGTEPAESSEVIMDVYRDYTSHWLF